MPVGNICSTELPTDYGNLIFAVLPEHIHLGRTRSGAKQSVCALLEHVLIYSKTHPPDQHTQFHIFDYDPVRDIFNRPKGQGDDNSVPACLKRISEGANEAVITVQQPPVLKHHALSRRVAGRALPPLKMVSVEDICKRLGEHVHIGKPTHIIHHSSSVQNTTPSRVETEAGSFRLELLDVKERMKMPDLAWKALFPKESEKPPAIIVARRHFALIADTPVPEGQQQKFRVHSSCFTGDICCSGNCDCGHQFRQSLKEVMKTGGGVIYQDAEGRGVGLALKILMYDIRKEMQLTTYTSMQVYEFDADERYYGNVAKLARDTGIDQGIILTNNMDKVQKLKQLGFRIAGREDIIGKVSHREAQSHVAEKFTTGPHRLLGEPEP